MNDTDLGARLESIEKQLAYLTAAQQRREETLDELLPILGLAVTETSNRMQKLEDQGYFEFGRRMMGVMDSIVEGFTPDDVEQLGNNVVSILRTVRHVTQPRMLAMANDAANAVDGADEATPVGVFGMLKASKDEDVKRGLAVAVGVLREIGKRAHRVSADGKSSRNRLSARLGPRNAPAPNQTTANRKPAPKRSAPPPPTTKKVALEIPGVELDENGFLVDPTTWNQDVAMKIAQALGFESLTDDHWKVIDFARAEFADKGVSANVRKLATGSGLTTKNIYTLFRTAPGVTAARIAGVPKPVGCI